MDLDGLALHVRQHGSAATERQQRQQAEHRRDLQQRAHRARSNSVSARLAGNVTSNTSSSGMRRMPMPIMIAVAINAGPTRRTLRYANRSPVAMLNPMATAP